MKRISAFYKLLACVMAGISGAFCTIRIGHRFLAEWLPMPVILVISACFFLAALGYGIFWAFIKKDDGTILFLQTLAFWQGLVRYIIAINLIMIGMQGFYQLFFFMHLGALDLPFSSMSGEELTWAYFGHYSRGFVYFISSIQILGSLLLLYGRTKLIGIFILFPVMFVIVSLNYFFDMEKAETIHAIEILIALLYLLLSERKKLWQFFFNNISNVSVYHFQSAVTTNIIKASAVAIPLLLILRFGPPDIDPWLRGKYKVSDLTVNQQAKKAQACTDSSLTRVYFDFGNDCVFEFNSVDRRWYGTYHLSDDKKKIMVAWHYPLNIHDTLTGEIGKNGNDSLLFIKGKMGNNDILVSLIRQTR